MNILSFVYKKTQSEKPQTRRRYVQKNNKNINILNIKNKSKNRKIKDIKTYFTEETGKTNKLKIFLTYYNQKNAFFILMSHS